MEKIESKDKRQIGGMEGERGEETDKKEQLRADFASDGHITVSHPQSTGVVGAFCQTHYVLCPLRHFMENVNVFAATAGH